ncbi:endolytic transglycosylase MltG [Ectobacillus ponti]|uniref:Endolytic murein transglycosylase n=1 Tax=Ectobacillus ponti TaxID=2961894 RepID=A0AA41X5Z5_9BACI|nr:endolytic transglycosylase MltG [Ectobacillus ponti]MCP8967264.1 endolytic transglycosylase MltG [Ectobacillus ponti]
MFNDYQAQRRRKLRRRVTAVLVLLLLLAAGGGYAYMQIALKPLEAGSSNKKEVVIPKGTGTAGIGQILQKEGIIRSALIFQYYVKTNTKNGLQAGTYLLSPAMSVREIADDLMAGKVYNPIRFKLAIPEGTQLKEIAAAIAKEFKMDEQTVLAQLNDKAFIQGLQKKYPKLITNEVFAEGVRYPLEGYLWPATYSYHNTSYTVPEIIAPMLEKTNEYITAHEQEMGARKLTVHQLLTMGSLIEEEASVSADRQKIASVFYNRMAQHMMLQTDPTVLYALGKHKERVLYEDLKVNSPYNTYVVYGLPIGPIANAGASSLEAAMKPAQTDYLYFLAAPTGEVFFAKTLAEHNELKNKYITQKKS